MKIALFFGSFNPVHIGHMAIANYMLEFTNAQQLWFVVSPQSPFKQKQSMLNAYERVSLLHDAIDDNYVKYKVSDIEFKMPKPSYTIDTLTYLKEKFPKNEFALIMGSDNLNSLKKWKNYELILENHELYVYPRPDYNGDDFKNHEKVKIIQAPLMEISSSFIRKSIKQKKDIEFFMPHKAYKYMKEMHFYENL